MTTTDLKRKLAAIPSADVKGYSRIMGEDDKWAVQTLNTHKEGMHDIMARRRDCRSDGIWRTCLVAI